MNERWKIVGGIVLILATIAWLAISGIRESKTYYVTVAELGSMGEAAYARRLRVGGDVAVGSIHRQGERVSFTLVQGSQTLPVVYTGTDPLPDTFRDRAQALADGSYGRDGVFVAKKIQAKCASKYEALPGRKSAVSGPTPAANPGQVYESMKPGAAGSGQAARPTQQKY